MKVKSHQDHAIILRKYAPSTASYRLRYEKGLEETDLLLAQEINEMFFEAQEEYIKEIRRLNSQIDLLIEPQRSLSRRIISWWRRRLGLYEPMNAT